MSAQMSQMLRSDARDNRDRIVTAARELFAAEGLGVPMREIARHADVGPATLYRRFPTKQSLAAQAFADEARRCQEIVDAGLAAADPWRGFCQVVEQICELHIRNRGFTEAFLATYPDTAVAKESRERTLKSVATLARRAKAQGSLRPDFTLNDLVIMLTAHRGIQNVAPNSRAAASRRFAALIIQAFQG